MDEVRKQILTEVTLKKPYVYSFFAIFIGYFVLNAWINQLFVTGLTIFTSYRISFFIPFLIFLFIVPGLVALNINLVTRKFKELNSMSKHGSAGAGGIGIFGIVGGLLGGACPGCLVGLFPAVLGIFGVTGTSLSILPFNGLEIQAVSVGLLLIGVFYLTKSATCKVDFKKDKDLKEPISNIKHG